MAPLIHPTAIVADGAQIGEDTRIWHWVHVRERAVVGARCSLGQNAYVAPGVIVGDGSRIQNNVSLFEGVILEEDVFCGPSAVFTNVTTPRSHLSRRDQFGTTRVCRGATIGANATIVCGITIGAYAFVGAGSVVTRDVAPHRLVVGNPARPLGWSCRCGLRLDEPDKSGVIRCVECGDAYRLDDHGLRLLEVP